MGSCGIYIPPASTSFSNLTKDFGNVPEQPNKLLKALSRPHIDAFNSLINGGLQEALTSIPRHDFSLPNGTRVGVQVLSCSLTRPQLPAVNRGCREQRVFPREARQSGGEYVGRLSVRLAYWVHGAVRGVLDKQLGDVPVMVMSELCNLHDMTPSQLVERGELESEFGGYFIIGGSEKLLRMQVNARRNYPMCLSRTNYKSYGALFTEHALQMRCVRHDHSMTMNALHFLSNGLCKLVFRYRKERFCMSPVVLIKALCNITDKDIYRLLTEPGDSDYYLSCVASLLRDAQFRDNRQPLVGRQAVVQYLANMYRNKLATRLPDWASDQQVCDTLLSECLLIHVDDAMDKVRLLCFMMRKLYAFSAAECCQESADNPMFWEIQHGSHILKQLIKNRTWSSLHTFRMIMTKRYNKNPADYEVTDSEVQHVLSLLPSVSASLRAFIATGTLPDTLNIICSDRVGLSVLAEKVSFTRYMSHLRAVHRGSFFSSMRTTAVRQMLPEAWGFICPVHTPDGAPCGLLNHLTATCQVSTGDQGDDMVVALQQMGMCSVTEPRPSAQCYTVLLDGRVVGYVTYKLADKLVNEIRYRKCHHMLGVHTEVCLMRHRVSGGVSGGQFPALYVHTGDCRMVRPVVNLLHDRVEYIGSMEQVYLNVAVRLSEAATQDAEMYSHAELSDTCLLSHLALLVPQSDLNQSPRNMYQCQMSKQTIGTVSHNYSLASDHKLYRLQTPHSPFFRPSHHDALQLDNFAQGTNAIVAVISYTGYDMEDAMIINKHSQERGFADAFVYKTRFVHLKNEKASARTTCIFRRNDKDIEDLSRFMDSDGIPHIGVQLEENNPFVCYYNIEEDKYHIVRHMESEPVVVDSVKLIGDIHAVDILQSIAIVFRVQRRPTVGDKFASRAGQKGICSRLYPAADLPWTDSGVMPDIIFNPHGFPSRMTIAMMVECMAGKGSAVTGHCFDATPFRFDEQQTSIDYFASVLEKAGYDYYGTESMYSGVSGEIMEARIFVGVIHYQRLRHMVSDKWQVRSTGAVDCVTRQPVKGRRRGGGVRFGEMERDGMMAHGTAMLVHDRLLNCSDRAQIDACSQCGSVLTPVVEMVSMSMAGGGRGHAGSRGRRATCSVCDSPRHVVPLQMPYICLMLAMQLAAMNVKIEFTVKMV